MYVFRVSFVVGVQIDKTYRVQCQIIQLLQMSMKLVYKVKKKFKWYLMQKLGKLKSVLKKTGSYVKSDAEKILLSQLFFGGMV